MIPSRYNRKRATSDDGAAALWQRRFASNGDRFLVIPLGIRFYPFILVPCLHQLILIPYLFVQLVGAGSDSDLSSTGSIPSIVEEVLMKFIRSYKCWFSYCVCAISGRFRPWLLQTRRRTRRRMGPERSVETENSFEASEELRNDTDLTAV